MPPTDAALLPEDYCSSASSREFLNESCDRQLALMGWAFHIKLLSICMEMAWQLSHNIPQVF